MTLYYFEISVNQTYIQFVDDYPTKEYPPKTSTLYVKYK